jgi:NAD(P)-dependent dehydrogenase (short-subunit alcohol dehydrogenase family)
MEGVENRVAIVTGAGRGIGAAVAKRLAREGVAVVVNDVGASLTGAEVEGDPAHDVVREIEAGGGVAVIDNTNVVDHQGVRNLVATTVERFGRLDIVVNVAGILRDRMIFNMTEEEWDAVIAVHLKGHFNVVSAAAAHWRKENNPDAHNRIINITSGAGLFGAPGQPNYAAAKMGIIGLTYSCANSLGKYGVTANAVAPAANTRMTAAYPSWPKERWETDEWSPDSVAPVIAWLASESSNWCNGRVIGSRGYEVTLYNNPEALQTLRSPDGWTVETLAKELEANFRPVVEAAPDNPLPTVAKAGASG